MSRPIRSRTVGSTPAARRPCGIVKRCCETELICSTLEANPPGREAPRYRWTKNLRACCPWCAAPSPWAFRSLDTYKPGVMQQVLDLGADIVNDVWALRQTGAVEIVGRHPHCGVCLMHMHREPQTMQVQPMEGDVPAQVLSFLKQRAMAVQALGVEKARILLDPGIGFGASCGGTWGARGARARRGRNGTGTYRLAGSQQRGRLSRLAQHRT